MSGEHAALRLSGVDAGYHGTPVVSGVEAELPAGGWLSIVGPNGAGKSTLLKAVAGLAWRRGEIRLSGRPADEMSRAERARVIGYAPQTPAVPERLSVADYVMLGRTPHLGRLAREGSGDLSIVDETLHRLDLGPLAGRLMGTLSGGEQQRALLARVLAQQAGVLLLDEPTTGLDIGHAQALLELVDSLRAEDGITVVATMHDLTFAAQYSEQALLLARGAVAASGPPHEVLTTEAMTEHYGARTTLLTAPDGSRVLAPLRRR